MSSFNSPLIAEDSNNGKYRRIFVEFSYERGRLGSDNKITVPKGFITDGASVPKWAWGLGFSPWGEYSKAAVLHDWLYAQQELTKLESDNEFLESMEALTVNTFKRNLMFKMVRWFANGAWKEHKSLMHPEIIAQGSLPTYLDAVFMEQLTKGTPLIS